MQKKSKPKKGVFTWLDLKLHKILTNDLIEHAKILSKKFYQYESLFDFESSNFFDPKCLEDYNYIFVSDWEFDCPIQYIQFTAIDDKDEVREVAEISVSYFKMTLQEIDKLEKECEKYKAKEDKAKEDKKEFELFQKLKKKFEGDKK